MNISRVRVADLFAMLAYLAGAVLVFRHLWFDPTGQVLADNQQDQLQFEWMFEHATRFFTHGESPLYAPWINAPRGVNLMANTSMLALALPLAWVTLAFGAGTTFVTVSTLALAGTAIAWYLTLSRGFGRSHPAAAGAGAFLGFAPSMISHSTGHPNIVAQFLLPLIVWTVSRMREPGHVLRDGLILAGLVVAQCFIDEELLFFTALALPVFIVAGVPWAELPGPAGIVLRKLAVTAAVAGALLAYPLYFQFFGTEAYHGLPAVVNHYSSDLWAYPAYSRRALFGDPNAEVRLAQGATEQNAFFGWPLLVLVTVAAVVLWRRPAARGLAITAVVFGVLSLGEHVQADAKPTGGVGPWWLLSSLPLFDTTIPTRFAIVVTVAFGLLLALVVDALIVDALRNGRRTAAAAWAFATALALVPIIPTPQPVHARPSVPLFFTSKTWQRYLGEHATVVAVPAGWNEDLAAMGWTTATGWGISVVGGYFLAPDPADPTGRAVFGAGQRPTTDLLVTVAYYRQVPTVTDQNRAELRADVAYWHATVFVMPDTHYGADELRATMDQLIGPGEHVDDVWLWPAPHQG